MLRDEMRATVRELDACMQRAAEVLAHSEAFLRGFREPPKITTIAARPARPAQTPAARSAEWITEKDADAT